MSIVTIVLRFGVSSISVLNKGHAACRAVRAAVLMIYTPPDWVAAITIGHILGNGTAILAFSVLFY